MKVLVLTNEYPPHIYGGAGVHVEFLTRELARFMDVEVRCYGDQQVAAGGLTVHGFQAGLSTFTAPPPIRPALDAMARGVQFSGMAVESEIVHCHTWYSHFGGILTRLAYGIPLVVTVHSLEPLRPWKREQLEGGYDISCWVERTALQLADAIVAVSRETRTDILRLFDVRPERVHVIHNGIDPDLYRPLDAVDVLEKYGVHADRPVVLFVGRITRQKGIAHFVRAISRIHQDAQVVLCAGSPDTPEIAAETRHAIADVQSTRGAVIWIQELLSREEMVQLYSHAAVFCCPSIYEPFGIINLEAMACGTPVVASAVGGIPEVVVDRETGVLVPLEQQAESPFEATDPEGYSRDLADAINRLLGNEDMRRWMGAAGRRRAVEHFSWSAIAHQTAELYETLVGTR